MKTPHDGSQTRALILALAEIKMATDAFDRGEANAVDAMEEIVAAVETYRAARTRPREAA